MLIVFCGGIVCGIIFGSDLEVESVVSEDYFLVVLGEESGTSIFLSRLVNNLFLCLIFSLTFLSPLFLILSFLALFYRGFVLGYALIAVIAETGGAGVLLCIFLIIPTQVLLHFVLLSLTLSGAKKASCFELREYVPTLLCFYAATLLVAVIELAEIYVVIRPLTLVL